MQMQLNDTVATFERSIDISVVTALRLQGVIINPVCAAEIVAF